MKLRTSLGDENERELRDDGMNEERRKCDNKVAVRPSSASVRVHPFPVVLPHQHPLRFRLHRSLGGVEIARPRSIGPAWSNERSER